MFRLTVGLWCRVRSAWLYLNVNLDKFAPVMWSLGIIDDFLFEIEAAKQ
jgi:hypothetical protein